MDFQAFGETDENEAELFFEGPEPETLAPETASATPPARRKAGRGKGLPVAPAAASVEAEAPVAAPPVVRPPADAPAPVIVPAIPRMVRIALILAVVASLFSAVGLIAVARNLAVLAAQRHEAERHAAAFARLPGLLAEVEALAAAQKADLALAAAQRPAALVTPAELTRQLDGLRFALAKRQPPGTTALAGVVRQGQAELAHRIDEVNDRIDKAEGRRGGR